MERLLHADSVTSVISLDVVGDNGAYGSLVRRHLRLGRGEGGERKRNDAEGECEASHGCFLLEGASSSRRASGLCTAGYKYHAGFGASKRHEREGNGSIC